MRLTKHLLLSSCIALTWLLPSCGAHAEDDHDHDHEGDKPLTEAAKDDDDHEGAITLDPHQIEEFGIQTAEATPGNFSEVVKVSGVIEPSATDRVTVTARRSGIVTLPAGISVGKEVGAGAAVASISARGIQGGDANAVAIAVRDAAKRELDRLVPLHKDGLVTTAALNEAEKNYKEAAAAVGTSAGSGTETAPAGGHITAIFVASGDYVETGAPIATIVKNSRLTLRADVPQRFAGMIPAITNANIRPEHSSEIISLADIGGKPVAPGSVNPAVNGYIPVYFTFNSTAATTPGAFAEVYLITSPRTNVLTVPREALIEMQGNYYAYVLKEGHGDAFEKRLVKTGGSEGCCMEVLDGIKPGDKVVVKGATVVRMAETSAIAPPGHSHEH